MMIGMKFSLFYRIFFLKKLKIEDVVIENVESMLEYLDFERICYSRAAVGFH